MDAPLRTTVGVRGDVYQFDVTLEQSAELGHGGRRPRQPEASSVIGPWAGTEFYINAGMGFHSNDARGAAISRRSHCPASPPIA